jgi:hypothetical protein
VKSTPKFIIDYVLALTRRTGRSLSSIRAAEEATQARREESERVLADLALGAQGWVKATCEVCSTEFSHSPGPPRLRCNDHISGGDPVRRIARCDLPGCGRGFETFVTGGAGGRTRCNEHVATRAKP